MTPLDYVLLVSVMASGGCARIDRESLIQVFRTVYHVFNREEYLQFQMDVRGLLEALP
jgi:hypothetical protein